MLLKYYRPSYLSVGVIVVYLFRDSLQQYLNRVGTFVSKQFFQVTVVFFFPENNNINSYSVRKNQKKIPKPMESITTNKAKEILKRKNQRTKKKKNLVQVGKKK